MFNLIKNLTGIPNVYLMILSFSNKGLEQFTTKGDRSKIQKALIIKNRMILIPLHVPTNPVEMNELCYGF